MRATPPGSDADGSPGGAGRLVLVGTPIGNLGDLSPRAVRTLADADVVCCEDTRHSRKLFAAAGIHPRKVVALHQHNEAAQAARCVEMAAGGAVVAIITDAGMPAVSDPGHRVVAAAVAAGITVEVVPGPDAVVAALVVSGLPTDRFAFEGFLPRSGRERAGRLAALAGEPRTTVVYEAPGRLAATLADLAGACGPDRPGAVVRELTKVHEEVWRGTLAELATGAGRRQAVDAVTAVFGVGRRRVYQLALTPSPDAPDHRAPG